LTRRWQGAHGALIRGTTTPSLIDAKSAAVTGIDVCQY